MTLVGIMGNDPGDRSPSYDGAIRQGVGETGHSRGKAGISGSCHTIIPSYISHMTAAVWRAFYLAFVIKPVKYSPHADPTLI